MAKKRKSKVPLIMDEEMAMREQLEAFRAKFGRDPEPTDPVFFDPDADTPQPLDPKKVQRDIVAAMEMSGSPPQFIYAYKKTGLLLTQDSRAPKEARREWKAAIDEYFSLEEKKA